VRDGRGIPTTLLKHLPIDTPIALIDVGASEGLFTEAIHRYCGVRKALLVEPQPARAAQIRGRLPGSEFLVECVALADSEATVTMDVLQWDFSSSLLPIRRDFPEMAAAINLDVKERIEVRVTTLDSLCSQLGFDEPVDLLKIDVQGLEDKVLAGSCVVLSRVKSIWMELSFQPLYEGSPTIERMISLCRRDGFILVDLQEGFRASTGELLQADGLFTRPTG
jgi:FkbM family methyltransferase